ncbi:hypothetical protein [Aeoliella mucimassa]|uniref:Uncharacterized protein n=1 Tax=Aeoliella mucimassa TaxID=2527972 RepID=A0A518AS50_9BACT|nr:hypothetical protein [Aeoliella mucimassa]QDU57536.1 hypothetical protein Pan181_37540 [Aeoliella mucimassa]
MKNSYGTVTSVDTVNRAYEVKFDGSERTHRVTADESPDIEFAYAIWKKKLRRRRHQEAIGDSILVNPLNFESETRPRDSSQPDYFQWQPSQPQAPTIHTPPNQVYTGLDGLSLFPATTTHVFQQSNPMTQHQAAWHQQVHDINLNTHWSQREAQYLQEIGQSTTQTQVDARHVRRDVWGS